MKRQKQKIKKHFIFASTLIVFTFASPAWSAGKVIKSSPLKISVVAAPVPGSNLPALSLQSLSSSAQSQVPVTFAHVFKKGQFLSTQSLSATLGGASIPLQVDKKAFYADGSVLHAVLSTQLSSLAANSNSSLALAVISTPAAGADVALSDLLASNYDCLLTVTIAGVDYTLSAKSLLQAAPPQVWLKGPIVSEWIVGGQILNAQGVKHPNLAAYFHVRAYAGMKSIRTDVVIENNLLSSTTPKDFTYTANVKISGSSVFTQTNLTHYARARWHKVLWSNTAPLVFARHDTNYIQDTGATPRYKATKPTESYLSSMLQSCAPMTNCNLSADFGNTGAQDQIAPLPRWDATYLVSGDPRAFNAVLANASAGGTYGDNGHYGEYAFHLRDDATGLPVSIDNHPNLSVASDTDLTKSAASANPYAGDVAHQPSIGYLAYLTTGDYFYLEELHFWAAFELYFANQDYRNFSAGWFYTGTVRGMAWAYRTVGYAAYITPDSHTLKSYFTNKIKSNLKRDSDNYVTGTGPDKTVFGTVYMAEGNNEYRSFMDDFYTWSIGNLITLGFSEAVPLLQYKSKFIVGRMGGPTSQPNGFCFQLATGYTHPMGPTATTYYSSWSEVYANIVTTTAACGTQAMATYLSSVNGETYVLNQMGGYQAMPDGYVANMQPGLAILIDNNLADINFHWKNFKSSAVQPDYTDSPQFAIIPLASPR